MLASMVEINNLNGVRKLFGDQIPDPSRTIAHDHLLRTTPATFPRCQTLPRFRWPRCRWWNPDRGSRSPSGPRWSARIHTLTWLRADEPLALNLALSTQRLFSSRPVLRSRPLVHKGWES